MKLNDDPFQKIKTGEKTIELRLYDEKRRRLDYGDYIIFSRVSNPDDILSVKIKALYRSGSFRELFEGIPIEKCGNSSEMSVDDFIASLRKYYAEEDEFRYGVLGIKVELIDYGKVLEVEEQFAEGHWDYYFPDGMK